LNSSSHTILVTGGASGIGLALAERWLHAGSTVIICGRRGDKLAEAQQKHPALQTRICDLANASERVALAEWATSAFPALDMLVNNAGIQRRLRLDQNEDWQETGEEIRINLDAPIHLARLFIPHLLKQKDAAIVNVGSGLAFVPLNFVPVYCATKAALHSFTLSLRRQLSATAIQVIEIIPPAVDTDLGGPGLHTFGVPVNEFADAVFKRLENGDLEIPYGFSEQSSRASREQLDAIFERMNAAPR